MSKGFRSELKELPMEELEQFDQGNTVLLTYNQKYNTIIYEPLLIK